MTTATMTCPQCGSAMKVRRGGHGEFLGCSRYPACKATSPLPIGFAPKPSGPPPEAPGPTEALISDLRRAAGHLGAAIDILRRRAPQLDALLTAPDDEAP
jgi:ssDNA-binding Zn-finger/Zn-ribbon topoisomerase 1